MVAARKMTSMEGELASEFDFSMQDFERVRQLIHARAGIALSSNKQKLIYGRLGRRLRVLGLSRFRDYLDELEAGGPQEWEEFINALTTNLTSFYREAHHFPVLADLLRRVACERRVTLWCSACSTGEEPYSMAMTTLDAPGPGAPVRIPATDIDTSVLAQAEKGVYPAERIASLPAGYEKNSSCGAAVHTRARSR